MPKKITGSQDKGHVGESEFVAWASKRGWYPTKLNPDCGIDYVCQIRGDRISSTTFEMPGHLLNVSVRSTEENSASITIKRSDAELILSASGPTVLALVRRASSDEAAEVAIRIPDETFLEEIESFLKGDKKTHTVRFSDAVTDTEDIQQGVESLFQQPYATRIARIRTELSLKGLLQEPHVEILYTPSGPKAYVSSKDLKGETKISQKLVLEAAVQRVGIGVIFIPKPLGSSQVATTYGEGLKSDAYFASPRAHKELSLISKGTGAKNFLHISEQIMRELSFWNYSTALAIADQLKKALQDSQVDFLLIEPEILFRLARVYAVYAGIKNSESQIYLEQAKVFLAQIDEILSTSRNAEFEEDVKALMVLIQSIENGADMSLAQLSTLTSPYAIRIRLSILLDKPNLDKASALIDGKSLHLQWCDLAAATYAAKGCREKALEIAEWAKKQNDHSKYLQCVVRLASALFARALANQEPDKNILPQNLSDAECNDVREVLNALQPVLSCVIAADSVNSELEMAAVKIAYKAYYLLGQPNDMVILAQLMYTYRPVPIEVAKSVVSGHIVCPQDLPVRLREDHPDDWEANILAVVVQLGHTDQHEEVFAEAKKLVTRADTNEKKQELSRLLQQIWQKLEGDSNAECEKIVMSLTDHDSGLQATFDAVRALHAQEPDVALEALDKSEDEDDIYRLQLRTEALMQKGQFGDAVDLLLPVTRETGEPMLLHKTADLAFKAERQTVAVECYEQLLVVQPDDLTARKNLAFFYVFHLHDIEKAAIQFQALHKIEPNDPGHTTNLAICLAQLYRPEESLVLYEEACRAEQPELRAVLGRAELHLSLNNPEVALSSLQKFRETFWDAPDFVLVCMHIAYAAGDEEFAHEAYKRMIELRDDDAVDDNAFQILQKDETLEMFKQSYKVAEDRRQHLHSEMLKGQMPWVWAAQISGDTVYWAWRLRTQEVPWIVDKPVDRASFCIYATNDFHAREMESGRRELLPLKCPPPGTRVAADISALITLHRLGLLSVAADYFGEILVPQGYLPTVLEDGKKMVLHQRSRQQALGRIKKLTDDGKIVTLDITDQDAEGMVIADEYSDSGEHQYRLTDLIQPIHEAGLMDDASYQRISQVCRKISGVDDKHPTLTQFQDVLIKLTTLETLTTFGLLDAIIGFYRIHINQEDQTEIKQSLNMIGVQEETRLWHFDLWSQVRNDSRFTFVVHSFPEEMQEKNVEFKDFLAFFANCVARDEDIPLLADDRACQAMMLNEREDKPNAAFGTNAVVLALAENEKINSEKVAETMLCFMRWRYRFVLPSAEILKIFAKQYRTNLPGKALREVAEYVQDCMRDMGLFGGAENTDLKDSMAMRLYLSWFRVIVEFLMQVWDNAGFSDNAAKQLTDWCIREFLPSLPSVVRGSAKVGTSSDVARFLISHALLNANSLVRDERMPDVMKAFQEALELSNDEYLQIVTEILDGIRKTES